MLHVDLHSHPDGTFKLTSLTNWRKKTLTFMWYFNVPLQCLSAEFVTLASLRVPSGFFFCVCSCKASSPVLRPGQPVERPPEVVQRLPGVWVSLRGRGGAGQRRRVRRRHQRGGQLAEELLGQGRHAVRVLGHPRLGGQVSRRAAGLEHGSAKWCR